MLACEPVECHFNISIMKRRQRQTGFTIVELLIVIVVIAILAAISIVAYNGIQQRARDSQRSNDIATIQKALEMYHVNNGGYPACSVTAYQPGGVRGSCYSDSVNFVAALSPKYLAAVPKDPVNSGEQRYRYVFGSKKDWRCDVRSYERRQLYNWR